MTGQKTPERRGDSRRAPAGLAGAALGALVALALTASPVHAQQSRPGVARAPDAAAVATAVRALPDAPAVDGALADAAWQSAPVITGFVQRDPDEGAPATERTEARVLYTDDALYVGVRAHDSRPDAITAHLTRRDESSPSDWISVMIDSYYDRRTAFEFRVNPAGVKIDVYRFDDNNQDPSWNAVWDVATSVDDEGWVAEFKIPFSQLRFGKTERHRFGFNIMRRINRLNEELYWRLLPKDEAGVVSLFGDLVGIEDITPPRRVEITPYVSATGALEPQEAGNPFRTGSAQSAAIGADLNIGLTSNLSLAATVNPDFGQVEADPAVVNLSAFETFFPERRPFFTEGVDVFRFSLDGQEQLFYTRRIGRAPQGSADPRGGFAEQVDHTTILGAAKLTGKTADGWTMGFLGALTDAEEAAVWDAQGEFHRDVVEPRTSYLVGRLGRDFRDGRTQVSLFATAANRALPRNLRGTLRSAAYTGGLKWAHRFAEDTYIVEGYVAGSHVRGSPEAIAATQLSSARYYQRPDTDHVTFDPARTSLSGYAAQLNGRKQAGNWRFGGGVQTRSPGLELNDLGFQRQADVTSQWVWAGRRWLEPGTVFRRFQVFANQYSGWTHGGERRWMAANLNGNYTFSNYWGGWWGLERSLPSLSVEATRGGPAVERPGGWNGWMGIESDERKAVRGSVGGWFVIQDESATWRNGIFGHVAVRPASNLEFTLGPEVFRQLDNWQYLTTATVDGVPHYVFGELRQTTASMTFRGNVTFTPDFSLQIYAEPFVSTGDYRGFKRLDAPRAERFADRFDALGADRLLSGDDGTVAVDLNRDGTGDADLGNPDFTVLSFRSNVVLRWEYKLGSTIFFVWQHGRSGDNDTDRFRLGSGFGDIFRQPAQNTFVVKVNYWLSL